MLSLPYYQQKAEGYCLPACIQMVLGYLGINRSQEQLAHYLNMRPNIGVRASNITRLQSPMLTVTYDERTLAEVSHLLTQQIPVIAFIQAGELPPWQGHWFQHAVVIVGIELHTVYLLDPNAPIIPMPVTESAFLLAWSEMDYMSATITKNEI